MVRTIITTYMDHRGKVIRICRAVHPGAAVLHAVHHMQQDHYAAHLCEVFDCTSGTLHAVLKRGVSKGEATMQIIYKRDPPGAVMTKRREQIERAARVRAAIIAELNAQPPRSMKEIFAWLPPELEVTRAELDNKLYQMKMSGLLIAEQREGRLLYSVGKGVATTPKQKAKAKPVVLTEDVFILYQTAHGGAALTLSEAETLYHQLHRIFGRGK